MNRIRQAFCILVAAVVLGYGAQAPARSVPVETKSLEDLRKEAVAEGGTLVMYAGGDFPDQFVGLAKAFETEFPGVHIRILTDFSKHQTPRIENELARNRLEADLVTFQNLQDFDRWKRKGLLLNYKPAGWDQVYDDFKDPDGAFVATNMVTFAFVVSNLVPENELPHSYQDLLDPKYKDKLSLTYPNDDDAILFQFKLMVDKYGWEFLEKLLAQNPRFVRGTPQSNAPVRAGEMLATFTSILPVSGDPQKLGARPILPDSDPFVSWASRSAIFKQSKHQATAKLFMNWRLSLAAQQKSMVWSVRKDVAPKGVKPFSAYNTHPNAFLEFMRDRAAVEIFRGEIEQYVGPVQGPSPTGDNKPGPAFVTP